MNAGAEDRGGRGPEERNHAADRRWTVLFIGDHGKVIAFRRIKLLIGLTVGVVTTALATVGVLVAVNAGMHARTRELQQQLQTAQLQIQGLREERDLLTAHVVLVESKMKETLAGGHRPAAGQKPDPVGEAKTIDRSGTPANEAPRDNPTTRSAPTELIKHPAGIGESVAVEAFYAGFDAARQAFDLRYQLVVSRPGRKPLAGHVILVLKGADLEPQQWLALPRVDLPNGRPSGRQKGYTFSISHSKAFAHSVRAPAAFPAFTQGILYVFSHEGQLLTARDYGVDVKPPGG